MVFYMNAFFYNGKNDSKLIKFFEKYGKKAKVCHEEDVIVCDVSQLKEGEQYRFNYLNYISCFEAILKNDYFYIKCHSSINSESSNPYIVDLIKGLQQLKKTVIVLSDIHKKHNIEFGKYFFNLSSLQMQLEKKILWHSAMEDISHGYQKLDDETLEHFATRLQACCDNYIEADVPTIFYLKQAIHNLKENKELCEQFSKVLKKYEIKLKKVISCVLEEAQHNTVIEEELSKLISQNEYF